MRHYTQAQPPVLPVSTVLQNNAPLSAGYSDGDYLCPVIDDRYINDILLFWIASVETLNKFKQLMTVNQWQEITFSMPAMVILNFDTISFGQYPPVSCS